jgi:hypothetical protein
MVRREVMASKVGRARGWLNDAAVLLRGPLDAFTSDAKGRDLSLFYLYARVHREARTGIPALRRFLIAVTDASGL